MPFFAGAGFEVNSYPYFGGATGTIITVNGAQRLPVHDLLTVALLASDGDLAGPIAGKPFHSAGFQWGECAMGIALREGYN